MRTIDNYIGINPYGVLVDDSSKLRELAAEARWLRNLPFQERLDGVKRLALDAMINAYEKMIVYKREADGLEGVKIFRLDGTIDNSRYENARKQHEKFRDIVFEGHPLSYALEQKAGCCRYQGALFFVLGYEAHLGDKHFMQSAPVNSRANTVFNEVIHDGEPHKISIFTDSLEDKYLDYSKQNPRIFEQAFKKFPGLKFYSYHKTQNGLVIVENPDMHIETFS